MDKPALQSFLKGQLCFVIGISICVMLMPKGLTGNSGITYYGVFARTIVPYGFALAGLAWYTLQTGLLLGKEGQKFLKYCGIISSVLIIGVLMTPYTHSIRFWLLHTYMSGLLFGVEYISMLWLALKVRPDFINISTVILATVELYATASYLGPDFGYLTLGQVIFQALFSIVFYRALYHFLGSKQEAVN